MPPLATILLCAYNHEAYVGEALRGALAQTYRPLQIIVCDDASTDGTAAAITAEIEAYGGPHQVRFLKNESNQGLSTTINLALPLIDGEFVIGAAGDDVSGRDRVATLVQAYAASGRAVTLLYSNANVTDAAGRPKRALYPQRPDPRRHDLAWAAAEEFAIFGCTMAWHRRVFDVFGPLPDRLSMEDLVIPFRAAILGELRYVDRVLVQYREHGANIYLGATAGSMSAVQWHGALKQRAGLEEAGFRAVLLDLQKAKRLFPERSSEFARLERSTRKRLNRAVATGAVFGESSLGAKLAATFGLVRQDRLSRHTIRWLWMLFLPRLYLSRLRRTTDRIARDGLAARQPAVASRK